MRSIEHHRLVENLFNAALDHGPEYLDAACPADTALRTEVEALLASYHDWSAGLLPPPEPELPRFGPYVCETILGAGGMGTVYRARRDDGQFTQQVAIKVLRGSLRTEWFRQRFLGERQILARLNHPHIARLLDGGMTADGEPYLVMELVEGQPISDFCLEHNLNLPQRIGLFQQVLDAVGYAHRNMVVHRDLKPSNILVTPAGAVKLLDFGTSKLTEEDSTATLNRALTPRYASPEQLRGQPLTTATDIFSLGVMLYELLSEKWPFGDPESGQDAWLRMTQEPEPRPVNWASVAFVSRSQAVDLTAIVHKALDARPEHRYRTAEEFSEDLRRLLSEETVLARRQTSAYRAAKFVRRYRWSVLAVGLLGLAIAIGLGTTLWEARRAERRFADVRTLANFLVFDINDGLQSLPGTTALQRRAAERSLAYMDDLLREAGNDQALRLEIAQAYRRLGDVLGNPFTSSLGDRTAAAVAYSKGLAALAPLDRTDTVRLVEASLHLQRGATQAFGATERAGLGEMRPAIDDLRRGVSQKPAEVEWRIALAQGLTFLGSRTIGGGGTVEAVTNTEAGPLVKEAETHLVEALRLAPGNLSVIRALATRESTLGLLFNSSQPDLAMEHYRRALDWLNKLPSEASDRLDVRRLRANILSNVGWAEGQAGKYDDSIRDLTEAGNIFQSWTTADPHDTTANYQWAGALRGRGIVRGYQRNAALAANDFLAAADLHKRLSAKDPANVVYRYLRGELLARTGNLLLSLGNPSQAREYASEGLAILTALADSPKAGLTHVMGACRWLTETELKELRQPARAAGFCRSAAERTGQKDPDPFEGLATALDQLGDTAGAVAAAQKAVDLLPPSEPGRPVSQQRVNMERALHRYQAKLH